MERCSAILAAIGSRSWITSLKICALRSPLEDWLKEAKSADVEPDRLLSLTVVATTKPFRTLRLSLVNAVVKVASCVLARCSRCVGRRACFSFVPFGSALPASSMQMLRVNETNAVRNPGHRRNTSKYHEH